MDRKRRNRVIMGDPMRVLKGNFDMCGHATCSLGKLFATNGQCILDIFGDSGELDPQHRIGESVVTIPLDDIFVCKTTLDLSKYGFIEIQENIWKNLFIDHNEDEERRKRFKNV